MLTTSREIAWCDIEIELSGDPIGPPLACTRAGKTASALARTAASAGPIPRFAINAAWLELDLCGIDLIAWTQHLLLSGNLAMAEPKLRYRLLHVPARIARTAPD